MSADSWSTLTWWGWLLLIVLLALGLRITGLEVQSLWLNELDSWWISQHDDLGMILGRRIIDDPHPQGFQFLLYLIMQNFGDDAIVLRGLSVVSGTLSVLMIGMLGERLYDRRTGVWAALLIAVLWMPIYYAQEGRAYATLMLATITSSWILLGILQRVEGKLRVPWHLPLTYALIAGAMCYLHYFALLIVGFHCCVLLLRLGLSRQTVLLPLGVALLFGPWVPSLLNDLTISSHFIPPVRPGTLVHYYLAVFHQSWLVALCLGLPMQIFATVTAWRQRDPARWRRDPTLFLLLWITLPIGVALFKSLISLPVITDRNLIICLPAFVLLTARGLALVPWNTRERFAMILVGALLLAHLVLWQNYYGKPTKEDYRGAVQQVLSHPTHAGAPVAGVRHAYYYDYYLEHLGARQRTGVTVLTLADAPRLEQFASDAPGQTFWLLEGFYFQTDAQLKQHLQEHYEVLEAKNLTRATARLLKLKPSREP